jgi:iron complex transport system permease protein
MSGRRRQAMLAGLVVLTLLVTLVVLLGLAVGSRHLPLADVVLALQGHDVGDTTVIVLEQRLPRTLLGVLVGAALGMGGAIAQGVTRNPLADPALLGVSAGAALAIVVGTLMFGVTALAGQIPIAVLGATFAGAAVLGLSHGQRMGHGGAAPGRRLTTPVGLALIGLAASSIMVSITSTLVLLDARTLDEYRLWLVGSLAGKGSPTLIMVAPIMIVGMAMAALTARSLDALALGDDIAQGLGVRIHRTRMTAGLMVVILTGTAVAAVGPIAFIGLAVPHAARALTGARHRWLLWYAALLGAATLVIADVVGRVVAAPNELQAGVVTAFVGAPFVLALLRRTQVADML